MKRFWTDIKHKRTDTGEIAPLEVTGKLVTLVIDRTTALNAHFQSVFSKQKPLTLQQSTESTILNNDLDNC